MAIKRLNYFDHQFLVVDDFKDEQKYHRDMRQRLTKGLHTFGIAEGLAVLKTGNRQVTVQPGVAIDRDGQALVVEATHPGRVLDLSNLATFPAGSTVQVTATYAEPPINPLTDTRAIEEPRIEAKTAAPPTDGTVIRLAQFTLSPDVPGALNDAQDGGARQSAGAKLGPAAVAEANLAPTLLAKVNTPLGLVSVDSVSNSGGNVDLVAGSGITIASDNVAKTITIGNNITAAAIGALLVSNYELGQRKEVDIRLSQADGVPPGAPATRTTNLGFTPRLIVGVSTCRLFLGTQEFNGGSVGFFDALAAQQRCSHFGADRMPDPNGNPNVVNWFPRPPIISPAPPPPPAPAPTPPVGIGSFSFVDRTGASLRGEQLTLSVTTGPGTVTLTLTRTIIPIVGATVLGGTPAVTQTFDIFVNLFCMGGS